MCPDVEAQTCWWWCAGAVGCGCGVENCEETVGTGGVSMVSLCCVLSFVLLFGVGGFLLSHNLPVAVPSALAGLASGFGMGPGVSLLL